jgi:hypothetical protein
MAGRRVKLQVFWLGAMAAGLSAIVGCGGTERPKTIPIKGRVLVDGAEPGEFGKLFFTPTQPAPGYDRRPASGSFGPDGVYRVMSWEPDDGLVPGHYTVNVQPSDASKSKIPPRFRDSGTSGLEVEVPMDQGEVEFDVKVVSK